MRKPLWYNFWRYIVVKTGLYFLQKYKNYWQRESAKRKPILITPNHQNALIDALLIESMCQAPYLLLQDLMHFQQNHKLVSSQFKHVTSV